VEIAKLVLDFLKAVLVWPLVAAFSIWLFRKEVRILLARLVGVVDRIKKADFPGVSLELSELLASQAKPKISQTEPTPELELSASTGGYSIDYRAIVIVVGITNRTDKADQVLGWRLSLPSEHLELAPSPAPPNTLPKIPWWSAPTIEIPPNKFIQGTLFFRGRDTLQVDLPKEPVLGRLTANTLHGKELVSDVKVYRLSTLQQNPSLDP
jgi:hypothetical protein